MINTYDNKKDFEILRNLLKEDDEKPINILHNEDVIIIQYNGFSINLSPNGTFIWEDTTGG